MHRSIDLRLIASFDSVPGRLTRLSFVLPDARTVCVERVYRGDGDLWLADFHRADRSSDRSDRSDPAPPRPFAATPGPVVGQAAWRPTSGGGEPWVVLVSPGSEENVDLYLCCLADGRTIRLTDHPANDYMPAWNPRGDKLVFVSGRTGSNDLHLLTGLDRLIESAGRVSGGSTPLDEPIRITSSHGDEVYPSWSPDGRYLAYTSSDIGPHETARRLNNGINVIQVEPTLGHPIRVTHDESTAEFQPSWSPDMAMIAYYIQSEDLYWDAERDEDVEIHIGVSALTYCTRHGRLVGGRRLRGVTRYLARSVTPSHLGGPVWMPDTVPALLYLARRETGEQLSRASVSRWLSPGSEFESAIGPVPPHTIGLAVSPALDLVLTAPDADRWQIWSDRVDPEEFRLPGERSLAADSVHVPCCPGDTRGRPRFHWTAALVASGLGLIVGWAIGR